MYYANLQYVYFRPTTKWKLLQKDAVCKIMRYGYRSVFKKLFQRALFLTLP